jgi:hypothetical protein
VYGRVLPFQIKHGKVWVQNNMTEMPIVQELGVAREDIVLGFQAGYMREYNEYGVA